MKWTHLPSAGGLYDQNPDILEAFSVIFSAQGQQQERERLEQEAKSNKGMGNNKRGGARPMRHR